MNKNINSVLAKIRSSLSEDVIGVNEIPIEGPMGGVCSHGVREEFFDVLDDVVDSLMCAHGMQETAAFNYVAKVGDLLSAEGLMPPYPTDDMGDKDVARWVGSAAYRGFKQKVQDYYHQEMMK
jgi:hypothetical protein